ncbi:hypothetical protein [Amycolatopsis sp. NPDC059657]|uniref:hypothetical protein n=1 Tax=Amycolatopsis sp. NPDC059657 TaxID=3346899 RepID=UPI003671D60D
MGLDYSYEIYLPPQNIGTALVAYSALAPPRDTPRPLELLLPGGERLDVPFTSRFKSDPVDRSEGGEFELDTTVMIGMDDHVRDFFDDGCHREYDEHGRLPLGYVYLSVDFASGLHPLYASMRFTAATTGMSLLFERSAAIRSLFTGLTAAVGGVCCLLDNETHVYELYSLNGEEITDSVPGSRFLDRNELAAAWS